MTICVQLRAIIGIYFEIIIIIKHKTTVQFNNVIGLFVKRHFLQFIPCEKVYFYKTVYPLVTYVTKQRKERKTSVFVSAREREREREVSNNRESVQF